MQRGRKVTTEKPYINGYIFAHFDVDDAGWRKISSCRGVKHVLSTSPEHPTRIRGDAMQVILDQCTSQLVDGVTTHFVNGAAVDTTLGRFIPLGSRVKMGEGVWAGHIGKVELTDGDRLNVLMHLFGRPTMVQNVAAGTVELVA